MDYSPDAALSASQFCFRECIPDKNQQLIWRSPQSLYGMNFFAFNQRTARLVIAEDFWIYVATWLPLTTLTFLGYVIMVLRRKSCEDEEWHWQRSKKFKRSMGPWIELMDHGSWPRTLLETSSGHSVLLRRDHDRHFGNRMKALDWSRGTIVPDDLSFEGANGDYHVALGCEDSFDARSLFDFVCYCQSIWAFLHATAAVWFGI